ncbi:sel1 repeat family protein [bacterium D16-51]|nr:sel1 repeat family protein [bacterium D16-59]RKI62126.1 sel1 repeat family protein [bacterium D16-51]
MDYSTASNEELERLVNNKDGDAICELGERCMYGTGGHEMNLTRAYQLFHRGEKMGLPRAYIGLGEMYRNGIRLAKNEDVAKQYYKKAGVPYPERESALQQQKNSMFQTPSKIQSPGNLISEGITYAEIKSKLDSAEQARMGRDYCRAGILCMEVIGIAKDVLSGAVNYSGSGDVEDFLTEANWILAYAAFNEQNYLEMDHYLTFRGVLEAHPWGAYLKAAAHRSMQSPPALLEQDLQMMFAIVSGNRNLSQDERGDICAMIGDLISDGYGVNFGMEAGMAKSYYEEAMNCGNEYAKERYQEIN